MKEALRDPERIELVQISRLRKEIDQGRLRPAGTRGTTVGAKMLASRNGVDAQSPYEATIDSYKKKIKEEYGCDVSFSKEQLPKGLSVKTLSTKEQSTAIELLYDALQFLRVSLQVSKEFLNFCQIKKFLLFAETSDPSYPSQKLGGYTFERRANREQYKFYNECLIKFDQMKPEHFQKNMVHEIVHAHLYAKRRTTQGYYSNWTFNVDLQHQKKAPTEGWYSESKIKEVQKHVDNGTVPDGFFTPLGILSFDEDFAETGSMILMDIRKARKLAERDTVRTKKLKEYSNMLYTDSQGTMDKRVQN